MVDNTSKETDMGGGGIDDDEWVETMPLERAMLIGLLVGVAGLLCVVVKLLTEGK